MDGFEVTPRKPSLSMSAFRPPEVIRLRRMLSYQGLWPYCWTSTSGFAIEDLLMHRQWQGLQTFGRRAAISCSLYRVSAMRSPCVRDGDDAFFLSSINILDRKSTRLNSSHVRISYAVFCLKKKIIK